VDVDDGAPAVPFAAVAEDDPLVALAEVPLDVAANVVLPLASVLDSPASEDESPVEPELPAPPWAFSLNAAAVWPVNWGFTLSTIPDLQSEFAEE